MSTTTTTTTALSAKDLTEEEKQRVFEQIDHLDEEQILEEMKGKVMEEYFYEIRDESGKTSHGLSWGGTKWIASLMAEAHQPLSVVHLDIMEEKELGLFRVLAYVKNLTTQEQRVGAIETPKLMKKYLWEEKGGKRVKTERFEMVPNPNAYTIATSKAQRNGMRHFMREQFITQCYAEWKAKKALPMQAGTTTAERVKNAKDVTPKALDGKPPAAAPAAQQQGDSGEPAIEPITREQLEYKLRDEKAEGMIRYIDQPGNRVLVQKDRNLSDEEFAAIYEKVRPHGGKYDKTMTGWPVQLMLAGAPPTGTEKEEAEEEAPAQ